MSLLQSIQTKHTEVSPGSAIPAMVLRHRTITFDISGAECLCEPGMLEDPANPGELLDLRVHMRALTSVEELNVFRGATQESMGQISMDLAKASWRKISLIRPNEADPHAAAVIDTITITPENIKFWWEFIGAARALLVQASTVISSTSAGALGKYQQSMRESLE